MDRLVAVPGDSSRSLLVMNSLAGMRFTVCQYSGKDTLRAPIASRDQAGDRADEMAARQGGFGVEWEV